MKTDWKTGVSYAFVHFCVELLCFYSLYRFLNVPDLWWTAALLFDALAFGSQPALGLLAEQHPRFRPGLWGGILLIAGAAVIAFCGGLWAVGLVLLTIGNGLVHISGAFATLRASEGRLSESAVFVGGGSFGLITGRLLGGTAISPLLPMLVMALGIAAILLTDRRLKRTYGPAAFDFEAAPCRHGLSAGRPVWVIVLILACVIIVRAYIGYSLPTAWNQTPVQTVFLYLAMGAGKMLGGILSDRFGARRVGILSCLAAVPALLLSNHIMWLSLIGVALFSMTMAITLGGLVSVLPRNPGIAFGITTLALLLGTVPVFFFPLPSRQAGDLLIAVLSAAAAAGLWYCLKKDVPHGSPCGSESAV